MRRVWVKWFVALGLMVSVGAHWAVLQSVAWVGMMTVYSRDASFTAALIKTFDGKHPCRLCQAIQQGRAMEKKSPALKPGSKLDAGVAWEPTAFLFDRIVPTFSANVFTPVSYQEPPPKPRPRCA